MSESPPSPSPAASGSLKSFWGKLALSRFPTASAPVRFFLLFIPLSALVLATIAVTYHLEVQNEIRVMVADQTTKVQTEKAQIDQALKDGMDDAVILAHNLELVEMPLRPDEAKLRAITKDFINLLLVKKRYSQARFLSWTGQEIIRVDYRDGKAVVTDESQLQDKSDRYYFTEGMKLSKGQVYVTPLDLNVEHKKIEMPFNPTFRMASPVVDAQGRKRGVIVLNYRGKVLFKNIRKLLAGNGRPLLVNEAGWWLMGPKPEDEWGFMLPGRKNKNLPSYYPRLWKEIKKQSRGYFLSRRGMFTFDSISTRGRENNPRNWHLIYYLPPQAVDDLLGIYLHQLAWLAAFLIAGLAVLLLFLVKAHSARLKYRTMVAENESRLRSILNTAADGIITLDHDRIVRSFNPAAERIFGHRRQDVLGKSVDMLYHPSQREAAKSYMEHLLAGQETGLMRTSEAIGLHKDGRSIPLSISASLALLDSGPTMIGMVRDVTARKEAQKRITRSAENQRVLKELMGLALKSGELKDALREALVIIYTTSWLKALPKGGFFLVEDTPEGPHLRLTADRNLGAEIIDLCGKVPFGRCHCGRAAQTRKIQFSRHVDQLHENSFPGISDHGHYNVPIISDDKLLGVLLLYLPAGHQASDDEMLFLESVGKTMASLIERRLALEALADSEARLRAVLENAVEGIVTVSSKGIIESSNQAMEKIFGYSAEELTGSSIGIIQPDDVREKHGEYMRKYLETGRSSIMGRGREVIGLKKDGGEIPLYLSVSEVRQGGRITFTGMLRDITKLKEYEAALTLAKEKAEETSLELLEKQKHLDEDLEAAAGIQQELLPHKLPQLGQIDLDWRFMPSQSIGGDLFNAVPLGKNLLRLYMLDVTGHGVPAAMLTVSVHELLDAKNHHVITISDGGSVKATPPGKVMELLDSEYPLDRFNKSFTINYLLLDLDSGELRYSSAGHPPPLVVRANGSLDKLSEGGTIIGLDGVLPFDEGSTILEPGDKLLLYTDGVAEYANPRDEFFGTDRLEEILIGEHQKPLAEILDRIWEELKAFGEGLRPADDVSMLALSYFGPNPRN